MRYYHAIYTAILFLTLVSLSCVTNNEQTSQSKVGLNLYEAAKNEAMPFGFDVRVTEVAGDYFLEANITLTEGSYIISPFSKDTTYGSLELMLMENEFVSLDEHLEEEPASVEEFDPILEMPVKFVRVNTSYKSELMLEKDDDFKTRGTIFFVIEPSCVPYTVDFVLVRRSGKIEVTEMNIEKAYDYKRG